MNSGAGAAEAQRGWRVGHYGRDMMYYEERHKGAWQRLEVQGEMLLGRTHHVIYFASATEWQRYPAWARNRRDEIVARIQSEFREPDYEYHGAAGGAGTVTDPAGTVVSREVTPPRAPARVGAAPAQGRSALLGAIVLVFAISAVMAWLVAGGLTTGETFWPSKLPPRGQAVARATEPGTYWTSIVLYAAIGLGTLGLGIWGIREGKKL